MAKRKSKSAAAPAVKRPVKKIARAVKAAPKRRTTKRKTSSTSPRSGAVQTLGPGGAGVDFFGGGGGVRSADGRGGGTPVAPSYNGSYNGQTATTSGSWGSTNWAWVGGNSVGGQGGHWQNESKPDPRRNEN